MITDPIMRFWFETTALGLAIFFWFLRPVIKSLYRAVKSGACYRFDLPKNLQGFFEKERKKRITEKRSLKNITSEMYIYRKDRPIKFWLHFGVWIALTISIVGAYIIRTLDHALKYNLLTF